MASFTYAKRYQVTARCVSPLRTGGIGGENNVVLTNVDGVPMIQAASIAGVLRSWLEETNPTAAKGLFGDSNTAKDSDRTSKVTVYDGLFQNGTTTQLRSRLRIDTKTGTGMDQHKFELVSVPTGSLFTFEMILKAQNEEAFSQAERWLEETLSALNEGFLTLGGQYSNGFGIVKLDKVEACTFCMTNREDRRAWLDNKGVYEVLTSLPDVKRELVTFRLTGVSDHFLMKGGTSFKDGDKSVTDAMKNPDGSYVLPGSSLKGVLRGRVSRIAAYKNAESEVNVLFGRENDPNIKGDNGLPGQLRVKEYTLQEAKEQIISRTRLDRFTGGVMQKSLFSEKALSDRVYITVEVRASTPIGNALLFYALRDMAMGMYAFGSESSVGRGYLVKETAVLTVSIGEKTCSFIFGKGIETDGDSSFIRQWLNALDGKEEG